MEEYIQVIMRASSLENEKIVYRTTFVDSILTFILESVDSVTKITYMVGY